MSTRSFIRHLEPYGYVDQERYDSFVCNFDVDLSELYEADKDINDRIDKLICRQSKINRAFAKKIAVNACNISALTNALEDVTCRLSEDEEILSSHTEDINNIYEGIDALKYSATTLFNQDDFIIGAVDSILDELEQKADKDDIEFLSGAVDTLSGRIDQEIANREEADAAIRADIDAFKSDNANEHEEIKSSIEEEKDRAISAEGELSDRIGSLSDEIAEIDGKYTQDIQDLRDADDSINSRIDGVVSDMNYISGVVDTKVSSDELSPILDKIDYVSGAVGNKLDKSEFNAYKVSARSEFDRVDVNMRDLYNTKADKSGLTAVSAAVATVSDGLAQEVQNRINGDANLQNEIDSMGDSIDDLRMDMSSISDAVNSIDDRLNQEIQDRIDGDNALIGRPNDASGMNTINAAKNYAKELVSGVSGACKQYSDEKDAIVKNELIEYVDEQVSSMATKGYVDSAVAEVADEIDGKVENEALIRENADEALNQRINNYASEIFSGMSDLSNDLSHFASVLKAVTEWDGENPDDYTDEGNGILDVLHREFHNFEETIGDDVSALTSGKVDTTVFEEVVGSGFTDTNITDVIVSNERVISEALNDLNNRVKALEMKVNNLLGVMH